MPKKTLDDWRHAWQLSPQTNLLKIQHLLRLYVVDSKKGTAGVLHPMTWFAASNGKYAQYLSSIPVKQALKYIPDDDNDVAAFLVHLKRCMSHFYNTKLPGIDGICENDELRHILQVIKENTGVDCFEIDATQHGRMP